MLLTVDKLGVRRGGYALLDAINFTLNGGDRLAIIGPAGAGKSLLLAALTGLLPDDLAIDGTTSFADVGPLARALGGRVRVLQASAETSFDPLRLIGDQLGPQANDILVAAGLGTENARALPRDLKPADLRVLACAAALAATPDLLIADDPCAGLDTLAQRRLVDLLLAATRERGLALILTTDDLKLAALLATRVLVLGNGRLVESGTAEDVFGRPRQDLTRRIMTAGRAGGKTLMRAPIGGPLLELRDIGLTIRLPDLSIVQPRPPLVVLDAISFALRQGETLALTGPTGGGKSSLLRLIAGLGRASRGQITLDGAAYQGDDIAAPNRRDLGYVAANPLTSFNPRRPVGEAIAEPLRLESLKPMDELSERIVEVVRIVGFAPEVMVRPPSDFTPGQLQRLALARALVTRPRLLLLDDPFRHLDVLARGDLLSMLARLRADFGLSLITATYDLEPIRQLADRVIVMEKGRIVETGTPAMLLDKPQAELTRRWLAASLPEVSIVPVF